VKQVTPTYINHSRPLILDGIHLSFFNEVERKEKPAFSLFAERLINKKASGTIFIHLWYDTVKNQTHDLPLMG